jgi:hypothetical protein
MVTIGPCALLNALLKLGYLNRAPKTEHVPAVIGDLEGPQSVVGIYQLPMHGNVSGKGTL